MISDRLSSAGQTGVKSILPDYQHQAQKKIHSDHNKSAFCQMGETFLTGQPLPQRLPTGWSTTPRSLSWREAVIEKDLNQNLRVTFRL